MNKILSIILIVLLSVGVAYASPKLKSDPSTSLEQGAVFQIMIDGIEQPELYPTANNAVDFDVQNFEGRKEIKVRFGNPWPDLADTYKWSDWSEPFIYNFPKKPEKPSGCSVVK